MRTKRRALLLLQLSFIVIAPPSSRAASPALANTNECISEVEIPTHFRTSTEDIIVVEGAQRIEVTEPKHQWVEERLLIQEAWQKLVVVPTVYDTVEQEIVVEDERPIWRKGSMRSKIADRLTTARALAAGLPADAQPGQCYAEYFVDTTFTTIAEKVVTREGATEIEVSMAKFESVDEQIATKEGATRLVVVPAEYDTVTETIVVRPPHSTWVRGDNGKLSEKQVPALERQLEKRILKTPAGTKAVAIEPEYKTIKVRKITAPPEQISSAVAAEQMNYERKTVAAAAMVSWHLHEEKGPGNPTGLILCRDTQPPVTKKVRTKVVKSPARLETVDVPARYTTVRRLKLVAAATEKTTEIPPEVTQIERYEIVAPSRRETRPVLCPKDVTPKLVRTLQSVLAVNGFDPGPIDGVLGRSTLRAIDAYQRDHDLAVGHAFTLETLDALGLDLPAH